MESHLVLFVNVLEERGLAGAGGSDDYREDHCGEW